MTDAPVPSWQIQPECRWCHKPFVVDTILGDPFFVCGTPTCFDRQCRWAIFDRTGKLFHLPNPVNVELEEAVESQRYRHILEGGSRGGSKSTGLRRLAYRYCQRFPDFTAYIFRRLLEDLERDHLLKAAREMDRIGGRLASHRVTWPNLNDSVLIFAHCKDEDSWKKYVGPEADLVIFDQAEMFTEKQVTNISAMVGRMRRQGWKGVVLYGENPGGPLAEYIDDVFVAKTRDRVKYPAYQPDAHLFIKTQVEDNPYIDDDYADMLMALDPVQRERYRFGNRHVFPGQYFGEFEVDGRVQILDVSPDLPRVGGLHWGYFRAGIFVWAVPLPDGRLYIERELTFEEVVAAKVAKQITDANALHHWQFSSVWGNPPSDIPEGQTGEDVFETFRTLGVPVVRADHERVTGFQRLRHWLHATLAVPPGPQLSQALIVSPACETLIKKIPTLLQDDTHKEDCSSEGSEQGANALRYIVMSRPGLPQAAAPPTGRDLSQLPDKVRADIERVRAYEDHDKTSGLKMGDPGWPFGLDWGGSVSTERD